MTDMDITPDDTTVTTIQQIYYGTDERYEVFFPDGATKVVCKVMTEGDRQRFQASVNRDVKISRQTGDMQMRITTGEERMALLTGAIVGWNLINHDRKPVTFSKGSPGAELEKWIAQAPPSIIDSIEKEIRRHEPWLTAGATIEDIDAQMDELRELREQKLREEAGNGS